MREPNEELQARIDADLRHAERVLAEFEERFAADPNANVRTLMTRTAHRPRSEALYPALAAAEEPGRWVGAMARRLAQEDAHGMLPDMMISGLSLAKAIDGTAFAAAAEMGEALLGKGGERYLRSMARLACALERAGSLGKEARDGLRLLLRLSEGRAGSEDTRDSLFWAYFRSGAGFDGAERGWSARVRLDIGAMAPRARAEWLKVFDPESRRWKFAAKRLGGAVEERLRRWMAWLRKAEKPMLGADDAVLLRHTIDVCAVVEGEGCDALLYEAACVRWAQTPEHRWLFQYLRALRGRPQNRRFACLEALMMNPATAVPLVRREYDAVLAVFGAEGAEESPVGADGFVIDGDAGLAAQQRQIDQWLRMAAGAAAREGEEQVTAAREAMEAAMLERWAGDRASLHRALTVRAEWIGAHGEEFSPETLQVWNEWMYGLGGRGGLLAKSLAGVDELNLESLLGAIRAGRNPSKVFELCRRYVAAHGWSAELVETFRQLIPRLGTRSNQTERARAEWFLWFEDAAPLQAGGSWSDGVKKDLRGMPPETARAWRALLDNPCFAMTGKPPARWMNAARRLFPKVGAAEFREWFVRWFEPFAAGEGMRLTITGRHLLRVLMWYTLVAEDEAVDGALLGFGNVRWKNRQSAQRAAQAEMAFRYVAGQRKPGAALQVLEGLARSSTVGEFQRLTDGRR